MEKDQVLVLLRDTYTHTPFKIARYNRGPAPWFRHVFSLCCVCSLHVSHLHHRSRYYRYRTVEIVCASATRSRYTCRESALLSRQLQRPSSRINSSITIFPVINRESRGRTRCLRRLNTGNTRAPARITPRGFIFLK